MKLNPFMVRLISGVLMAVFVVGCIVMDFIQPLIVVIGCLGALEWIKMTGLRHPTCTFRQRLLWRVLGLIYMLVPLLIVGGIALNISLQVPLLIIMALIVTSDTAGYLVGVTVGGPKILPSVSPKKTWSGTLAAVFVPALLIGWTGPQYLNLESISVFSVVGLLGQMGDFVESAAKRYWGVKDSGTLIPGHGGILDRVDSLLMVLWGMILAYAILQ